MGGNVRENVCAGIVESFNMIVDGDRQDLGFTGYVPADHEHNSELADCVGEAEHCRGDESRSRQRQGDREKTIDG